MSTPTPQQVLALSMQQPNDARAATIRDYLITLLTALWEEGEGFSGKRPLGNSSWEWDLFIPLVRAGFISGTFETYNGEETGGLDECDDAAGTRLISDAIRALSWPDEQQPADAVTAEQQQDGAAGRVMADLLADGNPDLTRYEKTQLRAVLAERTALAARVAEQREDVAAARRERDEAKAETAKLNAYLTLVVARYGNQTFYERDVKRAAELSAALAPDAAPDGRSEPVERSETSGGIGTASNSSAGTAGLSEAAGGCPWCGTRQKLDADGLVSLHRLPNDLLCPGGTRRPNDDTTEDGR